MEELDRVSLARAVVTFRYVQMHLYSAFNFLQKKVSPVAPHELTFDYETKEQN